MAVLLLGDIELVCEQDGTTIPIAGPKRRAVLAILALELGRVVPLSRICELLWGDELVPPRAKAAVQGHIAALRKVLPASGMHIETRPGGYRMSGPPEAVDHARFLTLLEQVSRSEQTSPDEHGERARADLLADALDVWRGSALAGLPGTDLQRTLAAELEELRTRTLERWARIELFGKDAGAARVIPALEAAARAEPLRESLIALLIRGLNQDGQRAQALELYERTRGRLADELGVDPGPELRTAAGAVRPVRRPEASQKAVGLPIPSIPPVAQVSAAPEFVTAASPEPGAATGLAVPQMLPPDVQALVGRAGETAYLDRMCGPGHDGPGRVVVTGPAGVGKTAAVVHWAHSVAGGFPDGRLFADLRGFDPGGPLDPAEVLAGFLRALGLPGRALPRELDELAELYQRTVGPLRLLVVLDNAACAQEVRLLIPGGVHCVAVVTSRVTLEELCVGADAGVLVLDGLAPDAAAALLTRTVGAARVAAEPGATGEIIGYCERLPLALLLCGARLALRPAWRLQDLVYELADERGRFAALDADGSHRLVGTLDLTRRRLSPDGARLLALLGLHPGADLDAACAAALLGLDEDAARRALGNLAAYHLTDETAPGRHARHSLIRAYSARLLDQEVTPQERHDASVRLLSHYADRIIAAREQLEGARSPGPRCTTDATDATDATVRVHEWFRREEPTLRALVARAGEQGDDALARLAVTVASKSPLLYFSEGKLLQEWELMTGIAVRVAERLGDAGLRARTLAAHATALTSRGRPAEAASWHERAVAAADVSGDAKVRFGALNGLQSALIALGRATDALPALEGMLGIATRLGDARRTARALNNLADAWVNLGKADLALEYADRALELLAGNHTGLDSAFVTQTRAEALYALGRREDALAATRTALARSREHHAEILEADFTTFLAGVLAEGGRAEDRAEAVGCLRRALELYERQGRETRGVRTRLAALGV